DVEARSLPGHVDQIFSVNLFAESLLVNRGSDGYDRIRMQVIHVFMGNERVQRCINRAGARVQVEDAVTVSWIHRVLDFRLWPALGAAQVEGLHRPYLFKV